jgi:hypothetical protein
VHERRLAYPRSPTEQRESAASASSLVDRGSKFGELIPAVDHTAFEVK